MIDFEWGYSFKHEYGSQYLIQGVTIANAYNSGSGIGAINILGNSYIRYKNCVITGGYSDSNYGNISINAGGIILENCYISAGKVGTNTTNNGNVYVGGNASLTITGCTVANGYINLHNSSTLTITGKNKINGVVKINWATNDYHIIIKSDAIVDMSTATGNINSLTTSGITVEDGAKIIPYGSSTAQSLPAGTYTTITRDGTCTV